MSTNLTAEPVYRKKKILSKELKFILQKRFEGTVDVIVDENEIKYFSALADAEVPGALEVMSMINKFGAVHLKEDA